MDHYPLQIVLWLSNGITSTHYWKSARCFFERLLRKISISVLFYGSEKNQVNS